MRGENFVRVDLSAEEEERGSLNLQPSQLGFRMPKTLQREVETSGGAGRFARQINTLGELHFGNVSFAVISKS